MRSGSKGGVSLRCESVWLTLCGTCDTRRKTPSGPASQVAAFLLPVAAKGNAEKAFRQPSWFSSEETANRLVEGPEPAYATEQARVVRAALEALRD